MKQASSKALRVIQARNSMKQASSKALRVSQVRKQPEAGSKPGLDDWIY
jgi:hypothetical protein